MTLSSPLSSNRTSGARLWFGIRCAKDKAVARAEEMAEPLADNIFDTDKTDIRILKI